MGQLREFIYFVRLRDLDNHNFLNYFYSTSFDLSLMYCERQHLVTCHVASILPHDLVISEVIELSRLPQSLKDLPFSELDSFI